MSVVYKPLMLVVDDEEDEEEEEDVLEDEVINRYLESRLTRNGLDVVVEEKATNDLESRPTRTGLDEWIGCKGSSVPSAPTAAPFAQQQQSRSHSVCHTGRAHQSSHGSSISLMVTKMQRSKSVNSVEVYKPVNGFVFKPIVQVDW